MEVGVHILLSIDHSMIGHPKVPSNLDQSPHHFYQATFAACEEGTESRSTTIPFCLINFRPLVKIGALQVLTSYAPKAAKGADTPVTRPSPSSFPPW